ncbi:MAG: hypothetical protein KA144_06670 [Xanthomonadaceae bacterium]|nr:hypothetical protein [Xanthomonadaceae bacterium]
MLTDELVAYNPSENYENRVDLGDKGEKCLSGWHCLEFYGLSLAIPEKVSRQDKKWEASGKFFVMQDFVEFSRNGLDGIKLQPVVVYESRKTYEKDVMKFDGIFYLSQDLSVMGFSVLEEEATNNENNAPRISTYWAHGKAIPLRCY